MSLITLLDDVLDKKTFKKYQKVECICWNIKR